jgi:hypothetical protein
MAITERVITAPTTFDGYFLKEHILSETGVDSAAEGIMYSEPNIHLNMASLTVGQGDDVETAIGTYVHPVDTSVKDIKKSIVEAMI